MEVRRAREATAKAAGKKKAVSKKKPAGGKILPAPMPTDDEGLDADKVQSLFPPGTKIRKDYYNGRWQCYWKFNGGAMPWRSISSSWSFRTSRQA